MTRKNDLVTVEIGWNRWRWDVVGVNPTPERVLARTLEERLRAMDTPYSLQIAAHMRDIRDMIEALPC